jgi:hypothetical protein
VKAPEGCLRSEKSGDREVVSGRNEENEVSDEKRLTEWVKLLKCPSRSKQDDAKLAARAVSETG